MCRLSATASVQANTSGVASDHADELLSGKQASLQSTRHAHAADMGHARSELARLLGEVEVDAVEKFYTRLSRSILHIIAPATAIVNGSETSVHTPILLYRVTPETRAL